jgi:hypothetical protein
MVVFTAFAETNLSTAENKVKKYVKETLGLEKYVILKTTESPSKIDILGNKSIDVPSSSWVFFVDEMPKAYWEHPCRFIFVSKNQGNISYTKSMLPPSNLRNWIIVEEEVNSENAELRSGIGTGYFTYNSNNLLLPNQFSKTSTIANDNYAVIINGGMNPDNNYGRFWNNCSLIYQLLVNVYGYDKNKIYVLMSDGTSSEEDLNINNDYLHPNNKNSSLDLDGDGINDVQYSATANNINLVFEDLKTKINKNNNLFVYTTGHGASADGSLYLWNNQTISSSALNQQLNKINAKSMCILMQQCYSGSFINTLSKPGRTITTAASALERAWGDMDNDIFTMLWAIAISDQFIVADTDNDQMISIKEAYKYAYDKDVARTTGVNYNGAIYHENPQYNSNPEYLGEEYQFLDKTFGCEYAFDLHKYVHVVNNISSGTQKFLAGMKLDASNKISGGTVSYKSYGEISLKSGFETKNANFTASILACNASSASLRSLNNSYNYNEDYEGNSYYDLGTTDDLTINSDNSSFAIYPNPTSGAFTIDFGSENESGNQVEIADITGKIVYRNANLGQQANIDLSGNASGVYFIRAIAGDQVYTKQIVLK